VDPEADLDVIQAAYRRLAQKYHPDRAAAGPEADAAALRMVEINAAWDQLRDAGRRLDYDRRRAMSVAAASHAPRPTATNPAPPFASGFDGQPSAGPPPGRPSGSVLNFGRYAGWSLGEVGRSDPGYLEWLDRMPIGRPYRVELDGMLRRLGRRTAADAEGGDRRGLYRRR
jgi:curved DNA-binding protein CbpA